MATRASLAKTPIIKYSIGVFAKLALYRYRRAGSSRQSNPVIVNGAMHADARAAVESVLGPLDEFRAAEELRHRRPRRGMDRQMSAEEFLAELTQAQPA